MHSCLGDGKLLLSVQKRVLDAILQLLFSVPCSPHLCVCRMLVQLPVPNRSQYAPGWGLWLHEYQVLMDIMMVLDF